MRFVEETAYTARWSPNMRVMQWGEAVACDAFFLVACDAFCLDAHFACAGSCKKCVSVFMESSGGGHRACILP